MKEMFTVREIMDSTGLSRQRVHQLIKSRSIPVIRKKKHFILSWNDLLQIADNPTILNFLKSTLDKEKEKTESGYRSLKENAKGIMYAYILMVEKAIPASESEDQEWDKQIQQAYNYWRKMPKDGVTSRKVWEENGYIILDKKYMETGNPKSSRFLEHIKSFDF